MGEPSGFIVFHDESPMARAVPLHKEMENGLATAYFHPRDAFLILQDLPCRLATAFHQKVSNSSRLAVPIWQVFW